MIYDSVFMNKINESIAKYIYEKYGYNDYTYSDTHIQFNNFTYEKMNSDLEEITKTLNSFYDVFEIEYITIEIEEIGENIGETMSISLRIETY